MLEHKHQEIIAASPIHEAYCSHENCTWPHEDHNEKYSTKKEAVSARWRVMREQYKDQVSDEPFKEMDNILRSADAVISRILDKK